MLLEHNKTGVGAGEVLSGAHLRKVCLFCIQKGWKLVLAGWREGRER